MPITTFNQAPYFDDYNIKDINDSNKTVKDKNYLRILFQPGFAVQTRELNQLQSILQNQIEQIGKVSLNDGQAILGQGEDEEPQYSDNVDYIEFTPDAGILAANQFGSIENFVTNLKLQESITDSRTTAKILDVKQFTNTGTNVEQVRLFLSYEKKEKFSADGFNGSVGDEGKELFYRNDSYIDSLGTSTTYSLPIGVITNAAFGFTYSIKENVYFINGSFVHVPDTNVFFKKPTTPTVAGELRFRVTEKQVNTTDDDTLLDNANGSLNFAAPGADRYQIILTPIFVDNTNGGAIKTENYDLTNIFLPTEDIGNSKRLLTINESAVSPDIGERNSLIDERLANRTKETDGNYVLQPFRLAYREFFKDTSGDFDNGLYTSAQISADTPFDVNNNTDAKSKFILEIDTSTAYVNGNRFTYPPKILLAGDKARITEDITNEKFTIRYGHYVDVQLAGNDSPFDISLNSPNELREDNIKSIRESADGVSQIHTFESETLGRALANADAGPLLFRLSHKGVASLQDEDALAGTSGLKFIQTRKHDDKSIVGSTITIEGKFPELAFQSGAEKEYGIIDSTGKILKPGASPGGDYVLDSLNSDGTTIKFTVHSPSSHQSPYTIFSPERVDAGIIRSKTLQNTTDTFEATVGSLESNEVETIVELSKSDIFVKDNLKNISVVDNGGVAQPQAKIRVVDDGQRNDRYVRPKIGIKKLIAGTTYKLSYQFFQHGSGNQGGDFFTVDSYLNSQTVGQFSYCDIPKFNGETLGNFIDFRIKEIPDSNESNITQVIPRPNTVAELNKLKVYRPRFDRLIISDTGNLELIQGEPALNPQLPLAPNNSMTLYEIFVPHFTCDLKDIKNTYIDNSRYTQRQIGEIDKRLQRIEYDNALSETEKFASERTFLNDAGTSLLFKSAFVADNFSGHAIGDVQQIDYLVAIDRINREARPYYKQTNLKFFYDFPAATTEADKEDDVVKESKDYSDPKETYTYNKSDSVVNVAESTRPGMIAVRRTFSDGVVRTNNLILQMSTPFVDVYQITPSNNNLRLIRYKRLSQSTSGSYFVDVAVRHLNTDVSGNIANSFTTGNDVVVLQYINAMTGSTRIIPYVQGNAEANWIGVETGDAKYLNGGQVTTLTKGNGNDSSVEGALSNVEVIRVFSDTGANSTEIQNTSGLSQIEVVNTKTESAKNKSSKVVDGASTAEILSLWEGTTETLFEQQGISQSVNVQPFEVTTYSGNVTLSPSSDEWVDTETRPAVVINNNGAFDAVEFLVNNNPDLFEGVFGTDWNSWQTTVQSVDVVGQNRTNSRDGRFGGLTATIFDVNQVTETQERTGITTSLGSDTIEQDLGERVVDLNIIPFIRSREIAFKATGLKPGEQHFVFFDGEDVTDYCAPTPTFIRHSESAIVRTYNSQAAPNSQGATNGLVFTRPGSFNAYEAPLVASMEQGDLTGVFRIPNNSDLRFRTGTREFKITSSHKNNDIEADSIGTALYTASGLLETKESQTLATRVPAIVQTAVEQTRVETFQTRTVNRTFRYDPIAQTFFISGKEYENGVFVNDIDLYFATKPDSNVDVEIYLVPTQLGTPTNDIIEGSRVCKRQEEVNASGREPSNPSSDIVATNFRFEHPIHLKADVEYAVVVFSKSLNYRVWTAVLGQKDIKTNNTITTNSNVGVFLKSQNTRTWTPDQTRDLAFKLNKCTFVSSKSFTFNTKVSDTEKQGVDKFNFSLVNINEAVIKLPKTNIKHQLEFIGPNDNTLLTLLNVGPKSNIPLTSELTSVENIKATVTLSTEDTNISPMFDLERYSLIAVSNNKINPNVGVNDTQLKDREGYITKEVSLLNPASITRVLLNVNRPTDLSNVRVFVNYDSERNPIINGVGGGLKYQEVPLINANGINSTSIPVSTDSEDFEACEFGLVNPAGNFEKFRVKVVFTATDSTQVCRIKNLVAYALT